MGLIAILALCFGIEALVSKDTALTDEIDYSRKKIDELKDEIKWLEDQIKTNRGNE